jgi:hypothetical protein
LCHVGSAGGDLARLQALSRQHFAGHTDVDHDDLRANLSAECVDHRSPSQEVANHLGSDLLRPWRDPLRVDSVVSGEDCDGDRLGQRGWALAIHAAQGGPEFLESTQRAQGFGEHRLTLHGGCHRFAGCWDDRRDGLGQQRHVFFSWKATVARGSIMDHRHLTGSLAIVTAQPCVA